MFAMKKLFITFLLTSLAGIVSAQSVQHGFVKEYNGTARKSPLSEVEISVRNASRTQTDQQGKFELNFRTLKRGDRVEVKEINKLGFEVFNKEAIEAWRIASDDSPFTIVLCKSEFFKALKDKYNAIASESYARQEAKAEAQLKELLRQGKMQQAEYEQKIKELQNKYEDQLDDLDTYIDRFARIDLGELSDKEKEIVSLVQEGKIQEAIEAYDKMGLLTQMEELAKQKSSVDDALSALEKKKREIEEQESKLYAMILNQIDLLGMAGGEENLERIADLYDNVARQLSHRPDVVLNSANFFIWERKFDKAIEHLNHYLAIHDLTLSQRGQGEKSLGDALFQLGQINKGLEHNQQAINLIAQITSAPTVKDYITYGGAITNRALMLETAGQIDEAKAAYLRAIAVTDSLYAQGYDHPDIDRFTYTARANLCALLIDQGEADEALTISEELLARTTARLDEKDLNSILCHAYSLERMGHVSRITGDYAKAAEWIEQALVLWKKLYEKNPQAVTIFYATSLNGLANIYFFQKEYTKAEDIMKQSLALYDKQRSDGSDNAQHLYASQMNDIGYMCFTQQKYDEALSWMNQALKIEEELCQRSYNTYILPLARARVNIMQVYLCQKRYDECAALDRQCLKEVDYAFDLLKSTAGAVYLYAYCNHGELLLEQGKRQEAIDTWQKVLELSPNFADIFPDITFIAKIKKVLEE